MTYTSISSFIYKQRSWESNATEQEGTERAQREVKGGVTRLTYCRPLRPRRTLHQHSLKHTSTEEKIRYHKNPHNCFMTSFKTSVRNTQASPASADTRPRVYMTACPDTPAHPSTFHLTVFAKSSAHSCLSFRLCPQLIRREAGRRKGGCKRRPGVLNDLRRGPKEALIETEAMIHLFAPCGPAL